MLARSTAWRHGLGRTSAKAASNGTVAGAGEQETPDRIATDPHRARMWDLASAQTYNRYASGYDWKFEDFKDQDAYAAVPLTAIWLRGPCTAAPFERLSRRNWMPA